MYSMIGPNLSPLFFQTGHDYQGMDVILQDTSYLDR